MIHCALVILYVYTQRLQSTQNTGSRRYSDADNKYATNLLLSASHTKLVRPSTRGEDISQNSHGHVVCISSGPLVVMPLVQELATIVCVHCLVFLWMY